MPLAVNQVLCLLVLALACSLAINTYQWAVILELARCRAQSLPTLVSAAPEAASNLAEMADALVPEAAFAKKERWKFVPRARDATSSPILDAASVTACPQSVGNHAKQCSSDLFVTCTGTPMACSAMSHFSRETVDPGGFNNDSSALFRTALYRIPGGPFGSSQQLHVPILKPLFFDQPTSQLASGEGVPMPPEQRMAVAPWPERRHPKNVPWGLIPGGPDLLHHCGLDPRDGYPRHTRSDHRAYCHLFATNAADNDPKMAITSPGQTCDHHLMAVFGRADVRLVLDIGGGAGAFARRLDIAFGGRHVTVVSGLWHESHKETGPHGRAQWVNYPMTHFAAATGFVVVTFDAESFFPFPENSFDVIRASWSLGPAISKRTIFEIHRVLRPGGFFVWIQPNLAKHYLEHAARVLATGRLLGWRLHFHDPRCPAAYAGTSQLNPGGNAM